MSQPVAKLLAMGKKEKFSCMWLCSNGTEVRSRCFKRKQPSNLALNPPEPPQSRFGAKVRALIRLTRSTQHHNNDSQDQLRSPNTAHHMVHHQQLPANSPTKQNVKTWWNQFGFAQRAKKDMAAEPTYYQRASVCCEHPHLFFLLSVYFD